MTTGEETETSGSFRACQRVMARKKQLYDSKPSQRYLLFLNDFSCSYLPPSPGLCHESMDGMSALRTA